MDRGRLSTIAHADHPVAAPLSEESVRRLLDRGLRRGDESILDLGCGTAAWIIRALEGRPDVRAVGVDLDEHAIAQARAAVGRLGSTTADRVELVVQDATSYVSSEQFDLVLAVGAAHVFGGLLPTLEAARAHLAPGGAVLVGDGFWERPPDAATLRLGFGEDEFKDLAGTVADLAGAGWTPVFGHVSTLEEWDDYEWSWTGTLARWALDHPEDPDSAAARDAAAEHRDEWLGGYRGTLGFLTALLRSG